MNRLKNSMFSMVLGAALIVGVPAVAAERALETKDIEKLAKALLEANTKAVASEQLSDLFTAAEKEKLPTDVLF